MNACLSEGATCPKSGVLPRGVPGAVYGVKALPLGPTGVAAPIEVLPAMREARVLGVEGGGCRSSTTGMRAPARTVSHPYKR